MAQYCLYMQNPFWRNASHIAFNEQNFINSRYYDPKQKDGRFTPLYIHSDTTFALQPSRASHGPSSYKVGLTSPQDFVDPSQVQQNLRSCVQATGNPRQCVIDNVLPYRR